MGCCRASHRRFNGELQLRILAAGEFNRNAHPRRQSANVGATCGARTRRERRALSEARLDAHLLRKVVRAQQLQQSEEPVRVVFKRRRAEKQHVPAEARNGRDRAPRRVTGLSRRTPQALRLIDDQQIDAGAHGLLRQLRAIDQHLDRDHRTAMELERVEVGAKIARHVGKTIRVEQREHLVVLSPQLAKPLDGQCVGRHHQAASHFSGVHELVQNERRLDGFPQTDFVRQQPANRIAGGGPLRHVQLVRKEPDATSEKRSQAIGLAQRQPPVSLPSAVATMRQARATAAPPLDPPALRPSPHGLRVTP